MMPYLSCKKIENDVYNFPTWQYCKYKDIFDSRIIINSTAKFYISISYQKDLLSIDTRIFTPSFEILFSQLTHFILHSHRNHSAALNLVIQLSFRTFYDLDQVFIQLDRPVPWIDDDSCDFRYGQSGCKQFIDICQEGGFYASTAF